MAELKWTSVWGVGMVFDSIEAARLSVIEDHYGTMLMIWHETDWGERNGASEFEEKLDQLCIEGSTLGDQIEKWEKAA